MHHDRSACVTCVTHFASPGSAKRFRVLHAVRRYYGEMNTFARHSAALTLLVLTSLFFAGCATTGGATSEMEPTLTDPEPAPPVEAAVPTTAEPAADSGSKQEEGEVPLAVAESEHADQTPKEIIVHGSRNRDEAIHDLVTEAQTL